MVETPSAFAWACPLALRALDVDNGSEFVNNRLIEYCLGHGIELTARGLTARTTKPG